MVLRDFHIHTTLCDGKNTAEEMVRSALEKGMEAIGFSGHSYLMTQESWTMSPEGDYAAYRTEIARLKEKYADRITIWCGIEQDAFSPEPDTPFDYFIGSNHFIRVGEASFAVDESPESFVAGVEQCFAGDMYAAVQRYYELEGEVLARTHGDIVGHFDLITKYNEGDRFYDTADRRYKNAAIDALDRLLTYDVPFEVNTGAISRGWRRHAYPAMPLMEYIAARGGSFVLSSDSHRAENIAYGFDEAEKRIRDKGWRLLSFEPKVGK